ncbi:MAG: ATP-binding protein [Candidatus Baldrarchaeia archaeon]
MRVSFVDRENELEFLEERWRSGRAEMIIVYGRRSVGKTEIVKRFLNDKPHYYFFVTMQELGPLLRTFLDQVGGVLAKMSVRTLEDFLEVLATLIGECRCAVVFDEFQRLSAIHPGALSILQKIWDKKLRYTRIFLILIGSSVGVMERIGKSYESPLYGRRTGLLEVSPLDYWAARLMFPNYSEEDRVRAYAVVGGVPGYLVLFDPSAPLLENIRQMILRKGAPLYFEPEVLLLEELRKLEPYFSILSAIAQGYTRFGEIADVAGIETTKLPKYMNVLVKRMKIVVHERPLLEKGRGVYRIEDEFFRFWFRFVFPNKTLLELGKTSDVLEEVRQEIDPHTSLTFEKVCKQFLLRANGNPVRNVEIRFNKIGKWWHGESEIDIVAVDERHRRVYFVECKWSDEPVDRSVLNKLIAKSEEFRWRKGERTEYFVIFSKKGFTFEPEEGVLLLSLEDMKAFAEKSFPIRIYRY